MTMCRPFRPSGTIERHTEASRPRQRMCQPSGPETQFVFALCRRRMPASGATGQQLTCCSGETQIGFHMIVCRFCLLLAILPFGFVTASGYVEATDGALAKITVVDADTRATVPCRLYVQDIDTGKWQFAKSADPHGSAIEYRKQTGTTPSVEMHTTLSAHPILLQLAPGRYRSLAGQRRPAHTQPAPGPRPALRDRGG